MLMSHFEAPMYAPVMALHCAEDVTRRLAESLPWDGQSRERWVLDLERLKVELQSAVHFMLQTLRTVSSYRHYFNKANSWYSVLLCENVLQELLSGVEVAGAPAEQHRSATWEKRENIPAWRHKLSTFLEENPPPDTEELVHLARLSNVIPGDAVQLAGRQMSERCMVLRNLLISSGPVNVGQLQLALQWQYELLRSSHVNHADSATHGTTKKFQDSLIKSHLSKCERGKEMAHLLGISPVAGVSAAGKSPSLSSFDSGFDGERSSRLEKWRGREEVGGLPRFAVIRDCLSRTISHPQVPEESVSDRVDHRAEVDNSGISIQIVTAVTDDSLNMEIKKKLSAALPRNVWLDSPVRELENKLINPHRPTTQSSNGTPSNSSPVQPTNMEGFRQRSRDWIQHPQSSVDDPELSPIRNVLSSTITDGRDESTATEGIPSLLWDSYDLHDHNQDAEDGHCHWPVWSSEDQLDVMSYSGFTEADVFGLEEDLDPAEDENLNDARKTASDAEVSEDDGHCSEAFHTWPELKLVHILDPEEHLESYDLQYKEETPNKELCNRSSDECSTVRKEGEISWFELTKEAMLEERLDKGSRVKKLTGAEAAGPCFRDDPPGLNGTALNRIFDSKQPAEKHENKLLGCVYLKDFYRCGEDAAIFKPEASLIPEMCSDDGVFDPGGKLLHPPMPKKALLPINNNLGEHESPCFTAAQDPGFVQLDQKDKSKQVNVTPAVGCHCIDVYEITPSGDEETPAVKIWTSSRQCPVEQSAPQLLPDHSLELDPGGRGGLTETMYNGVLAQSHIDLREILTLSFVLGSLCCLACIGLTSGRVFTSPPPSGRKELLSQACKSFSRSDPETED